MRAGLLQYRSSVNLNEIHLPSGDHAAGVATFPRWVSCRRFDPSAAITNSSSASPALKEYTICFPSGDQLGKTAPQELDCFTTCRLLPPSASMTKTVTPPDTFPV